MRILFIIGNLDSGGAEKVISTLANSFSKEHSVEILMISTSEKQTFYSVNNDVSVIPLLKPNEKYTFSKKVKLIRNQIIDSKPDVVISFLNYVIIYSWLAIKKIKNRTFKFIVSERNDPHKVPSTFFFRKIRNYIFSKADGCVFQTNDAKTYFNKIKCSEVIPNPVFLNNEMDFDYKVNDRDKNILMVGSNKKEKNRAMALKAFSSFSLACKDFRLTIVGDKLSPSDIELVNKLGIQDKVFASGKDDKWHDKYQSSQMFILTSNYEGMPNALLEAAALQIPCISTNCPIGGAKDILENGKKGILIPVNDEKELATQMKLLALSKEACNRFSDECVDIKKKYGVDVISKRWLDFIESIL